MREEVEVILFGVENDGDIKRDYKELADIEEFKDLNPNEVRFCWLVGNRTSPIFSMDRVSRIKRAMEIVWGKHYRSNAKIKSWSSATTEDEIPEGILNGILKMNTFNPRYRLKAKLMSEYIFETLNELIVMPEGSIKLMDADDRKKYADLIIKVNSELQGMVTGLENSYGIQTVSRKTKEEVKISINDIIY